MTNQPITFRVPAAVSSTLLLTPHVRRVTFQADSLDRLEVSGPAQWVKVLFPATGDEKPPGRAYTIRHHRPEAGELDIDFVLHGDTGPGSHWASRAKVGDVVDMAGPRGGHVVNVDADWRLLAGDETALPAIASILEVAPECGQTLVFIEVPSPEDEQNLKVPPGTTLHWLPRTGSGFQPGEGLSEAVLRTRLPTTKGDVFIAGEATAVRKIREYAAGAEHVDAKGYWFVGRADHRD